MVLIYDALVFVCNPGVLLGGSGVLVSDVVVLPCACVPGLCTCR